MKHFVKFLSPGTFLDEITTLGVSSWNIKEAKELAKTIVERHGAKPYGFKFFTTKTEDAKDHRTVHSSTYFLGGKVLTLEEVEQTMSEEKILIENMRMNKWDKIIINDNSYKAIRPFLSDDILVED
jgi:hypothetical protein